jgi:hypothetical protein
VRTHRRTHRRRIVAAIVAVLAVPLSGPAGALAVPADHAAKNPRPVAETNGNTPSDFSQPVARIGDTPAEFGQKVAPAPKLGDTPVDFPGASRAKDAPPTTIEIVRPERTIVRDTDPVLPIALSGLALLVALGLAGTTLIRVRSLRLG